MASKSRKEALEKIRCYGIIFLACFIGLFICGIILNVYLARDPDWNISAWYQIHYGAYILSLMSLIIYLVSWCGVNKAEQESRFTDSAKWVERLVLLLWISFFGMFPSCAFLGGFIKEAEIFRCKFNSTLEDNDEIRVKLCAQELKSGTIACLVFFIMFFVSLIYSCDDRNPKNEQIQQRSSSVSRRRILPSGLSEEPLSRDRRPGRNSSTASGERLETNTNTDGRRKGFSSEFRSAFSDARNSTHNQNRSCASINSNFSTGDDSSCSSISGSDSLTPYTRRTQITTVSNSLRLPPLLHYSQNSEYQFTYPPPPIPSYETAIGVPDEPPPSYDEAVSQRY